MLFLKTIPKALKKCYKNINWVFAMVGIDIVFMILINLVFFKTYITVLLKIEDIQKVMTQNFTPIAEQIGEPELMTQIIKNQDIVIGLYKEILLWAGLFIIAATIAWILTQTLTWFIAHKLINQKPKFLHFLGLFSLSSFIAIVIFSTSIFLTTTLMNHVSQMKIPILDIKTIAFLPLIIGIIISYFLFIFYTIISFQHPFKKFFKAAIENFTQTVPMFLTGMLFLMIIHFILILITQLDPVLTLVGVVVLLLPYLVFMRVYFCVVVKEICKE